MICSRSESEAGKMIDLMGTGMCVCNDCMRKSMEMVRNMDFMNLINNPGVGPGKNGDPYDRNASTDASAGHNTTTGASADRAADTNDPSGKKAATGASAGRNVPTDASDVSGASKSSAGESSGEKGIPDDPDEQTEDGNESKGTPFANIFQGIPNMSILNMGDLFGMNTGRNRVKRPAEHKPLIELKDIPAPHKIKAMLDEYVIGQEKAKKIISVAVYNHYKRVATDTMDEIQIEKSNMLMIGPTGCGKTYLVKTLAKVLDVPLAITDATSLTEAGYIGDDVESVVSKLLAAADNDVDRAEQGIIFIDEIDKIAKKQNHGSRDVNGEAVQQGMLRLLEGADVEVPVGASSKNAMVPMTTVNTRNILFICGGAFPDLEEIIKQRLHKKTGIGYGADLKDKYDKDSDILEQVTTEDLRKFGMIPEFLGRLPVVYTLKGLSEEMLVRILNEPKNAILKQYEKLLELDEVKLEFTDEALSTIAHKAMEKEMGARALRSIIEDLMLNIMYEIPKDDNIGRVTITKEYIEGTGGPIIDIRSNAVTHAQGDAVKENKEEEKQTDEPA